VPNAFKLYSFAPTNATWGIENRTTGLRVKATRNEFTHVENRFGGGASNPYLVMAACLAAGIDGRKNRLAPPPPVTGVAYGMDGVALADAFAYLKGENVYPPQTDWNIGHYLTLAGTVKGVASPFPDDRERMLVIVRDTYPTFGWDGYHLQPADAIANALSRNDGAEGGVLLFVAAKNKFEIEEEARARGFDIAVWDNGTPWPPAPLKNLGSSSPSRAKARINVA
jgi:hypothetical protein